MVTLSHMRRKLSALLAFWVVMCAPVMGDEVPLVVRLSPDKSDGLAIKVGEAKRVKVTGPSSAWMEGPTATAGGIRYGADAAKPVTTPKNEMLDQVGANFTLTLWIMVDKYPTNNNGAGLIAKRTANISTPFSLSIGKNGEFGFEGYNGVDWSSTVFSNQKSIPAGKWVHLAATFQAGEKLGQAIKTSCYCWIEVKGPVHIWPISCSLSARSKTASPPIKP